MITVSNLAKSFGDRTLFAGVSFQLNPGERYGLVGANGSGKTTLLRILSGDIDASEGTVTTPKRLRAGVLRQDLFAHDNQEILSVALMGNPELWQALTEKEEMLSQAGSDFDADRFAELEEAVLRLDGYTAEARAATILEGLGLPTKVHHDPLSTLSGGFRLRVLLAQVLASNPDVLLLDEPTNHLDILSIRWLETFLRDFAGPVLVISHDHRFLDNVSTTILDVDYETVLSYSGNYSDFIVAKHAERERRTKDIAAREREIAHHQRFVDRFRAKASKARQAQSKVRMIEKKADELQVLPQSSRRYPRFQFEQGRDSGREVLAVKGVKKAFGTNVVLDGVDLAVKRGDRLAIIGPNGVGKSTLLKIFMGRLTADSGFVDWGYETHPGYFAQDHREQFEDPTGTAEEWIWGFCADRDLGFVRAQMGLMLFSGEDGKKKLSTLSGGEVTRLVFTRLGIEQPNVLVLDEPTNHLDLESIEALVQGLDNYPGTLVFVSHDRWFVGQLATRILEIRWDGIRDYPGTYRDYVHACGDDHLDVDQVVLQAKKEKRRKDTRQQVAEARARRSEARKIESRLKKARQRIEQITVSVEDAEARVGKIDDTFCQRGFFEETSASDIQLLEHERSRFKGEVADLLAEWELLEVEVDKLERELQESSGE